MKVTRFSPPLSPGSLGVGSTVGGDVGGTLPGDLTVIAIQGVAISATPGSTGDLLTLINPTSADWEPPAAAGAPTTADYLVGTAQAGLSAEIVVGTTPGGELGGTWASPTVDATHSGSAHLALGSTSTTAAAGDHTHTGSGHLLITDTPAGSPLIFADLLQNDAGTDLLYADA